MEVILKLFERVKRKKSPKESSTEGTANRVLIIGSLKHAGVKCVPWDGDLPNVADYDAVIVNTLSLATRLKKAEEIYSRSGRDESLHLWKRLHQNVEKVSNGLLTLLESKGGVYVVAATEVRVS